MSRKEKLSATVLEIVPAAPPAVEPPTVEPIVGDATATDPILGPVHTAAEFVQCPDIKGLACAPVLSFDVLYNVINDGNGTADSFRGILNGRAYFAEQKYATRLRHANERASEKHTDGTAPAVVSVRKARHVDISADKLREQFSELATRVGSYDATMLRVPRELAELASGADVDFGGYKADFLASAVVDAQDALRTFGRQVNREAGERTTPADADVADMLKRDLQNAHDICTADACEVTVDDVNKVRKELALSWSMYKDDTSVKRSTLIDLSF